jgi:hypothetical protein
MVVSEFNIVDIIYETIELFDFQAAEKKVKITL